MAKKHKMTAGANSGVGRLQKIGKRPQKTPIEGEEGKRRADRPSRGRKE